MSDSPPRTLSEVLKKNIRRALTYWTQLTVSFSLLATGIGFISLYAYTHAIGRTDLFMPSIDVKSALVAWVVLVLLGLASYTIMLSGTTWLFGTSISLFKDIPRDQPKIALTLAVPTTIGFTTFTWMLFFSEDFLGSLLSVATLFLATSLTCLLIYILTPFKKLVKKSVITTHKISHSRKIASQPFKKPTPKEIVKRLKVNRRSEHALELFMRFIKKRRPRALLKKKNLSYVKKIVCVAIKEHTSPKGKKLRVLKELFLMLGVSACVFLTAGYAALPTLLTISSYLDKETSETAKHLASMSMLTLTFTLIPTLCFYCSKGDIYRRALWGLLAAFITPCALIAITPGALSRITYTAAGGLDVRHKFSERFVLGDDYELQDLNGPMWKTRVVSNKKVEIQAFRLFSFGDMLLLCPSHLLKLDLKELKDHTQYCISTFNSKVTRKPPLLVVGKTPVYIGMCMAPIYWKFEHRLRWDDLKTRYAVPH